MLTETQETPEGGILVVDDEISSLRLVSEILTRAGYEVRPAREVRLALRSIQERVPSLILLDVKMPESSGYSVCRGLKQEERTRDIPVIFVSGLSDVEARVEGFAAGGVDFISKPFQETEILARVRTHLSLRNTQRQLERLVAERTSAADDSEERFKSIFEHAAIGLAQVSVEGRFMRINERFCEILGYSRAEILDRTFQEVTHPDDLGDDEERVRRLLQGEGDSFNVEKRYVRKDGGIVWAHLTVSLVRSEGGTPRWFVAAVKDITNRKQSETKLTESHEAMTHLLSSIPDAVFFVRLPERVIGWADDSYNVMGLGSDPSEVQGRSTQEYFASDEDYREFGEIQRQAIAEGKGFMRTEAMARHKNGTIFPAEITATFSRKNGVVTGANAIVRDITKRKRAEKRILDYQERLRGLASKLIFTEERERQQIASDLHDGAAQSLALARLKLAEASAGVAGSPAAGTLAEASQLVRESLHQVRGVLLDLSSPTLERLGLAAGLQDWLTARVSKGQHLITEFCDECGDLPLTKDAQMLLFRSACELLTNVIKHAKAARVRVHLTCADQEFQITVKDDGLGFDPGLVLKSAGSAGTFGLFSIQERMKDLGGSIEISSAPDEGCEVSLMMPLKENTENGGQE